MKVEAQKSFAILTKRGGGCGSGPNSLDWSEIFSSILAIYLEMPCNPGRQYYGWKVLGPTLLYIGISVNANIENIENIFKEHRKIIRHRRISTTGGSVIAGFNCSM